MASVPAFGCFDCWLSEVASIRHCDTNQKEHLDADGLFDAAHEFIRVGSAKVLRCMAMLLRILLVLTGAMSAL